VGIYFLATGQIQSPRKYADEESNGFTIYSFELTDFCNGSLVEEKKFGNRARLLRDLKSAKRAEARILMGNNESVDKYFDFGRSSTKRMPGEG